MNNNLLIVGSGIYGIVAKEIAESMMCFEKIAFADDMAKETPTGIAVMGKVSDIKQLGEQYGYAIVAIGNPDVRLRILKKIEEETECRIVSLISPQAYTSPSAKIDLGCIVEPMAVIHAGCVVEKGCIVSAGSVVNHASHLCEGVHVDCNATVLGGKTVPAGTKIASGTVFE